MFKKRKEIVLESYGVGLHEDAKARLKHQTLMQDYQELQMEAGIMRSKLEEAKQIELILAAEVRFLRRRYEYLMKKKKSNSPQEAKLVQPPNRLKQTKLMKGHNKEASQPKLHRISEPKSKRHYIRKEAVPCSSICPVSQHHGKETSTQNATPVLDLNQYEGVHGTNVVPLRNSIAAFDLNQDTPGGTEASFPVRAAFFDLNEISTGDENFHSNVGAVKFEEVEKSSTRGPSDELQTDSKLSVCRNAGEGSSRVGKRKISWQDPVAVRV